jgi:hypothetical protein
VALHSVLDLLDPKTLSALGLTRDDLKQDWTGRARVSTQSLGEAVVRTRVYSAIRYPSVAAEERGRKGVNLVIFRDCLESPDFLEILGGNRSLQKLP